jgi:hypothetical protein
VLCGYAQPVLMLAQLTALVAAVAFVALYTSLVLLAFWQPRGLVLVWAGYALAALAYGGRGLLLGVLMKSELAGFFLIIMVSLLDTTFQRPVENPVASASWLKGFPGVRPDADRRRRRIHVRRTVDALARTAALAGPDRRLRAAGALHLLVAHPRLERPRPGTADTGPAASGASRLARPHQNPSASQRKYRHE